MSADTKKTGFRAAGGLSGGAAEEAAGNTASGAAEEAAVGTGGRPAKRRAKRPWHLWVMAVLFMFFFCVGVWDWVMIHTPGWQEYVSRQFQPSAVEYFSDYPLLPLVFWTANVVSGPVAVLLMVAASRWAFPAAVFNFVTNGVLALITFGFMDRFELLGAKTGSQDLTILGLQLVFMLYVFYVSRRWKV